MNTNIEKNKSILNGKGKKSFRALRESNDLYVDKTERIIDLIGDIGNKWNFISRPKRWGKSLLIDTMKELFLGNKELFQGTYAYNNWDWNETFPVVICHFDSYTKKYTPDNMKDFFNENIKIHVGNKIYKVIDFVSEGIDGLTSLVRKVEQRFGKQVAVLFDDYDRPLISYLGDETNFNKMKKVYTNFLGAVKGHDYLFRFFFFSGITKVAQTGLFSALNNLRNITFDENFHDLLGFTKDEIKNYYQENLNSIVANYNYGMNQKQLLEKIEKYYGGYFFGDDNIKLHNPNSIINFFNKKDFVINDISIGEKEIFDRPFIQKNKEELLKMIDDIEKDKYIIDRYNMSIEEANIDYQETLLLLFGYLTPILKKEYKVNFPNEEVKEIFFKNTKSILN